MPKDIEQSKHIPDKGYTCIALHPEFFSSDCDDFSLKDLVKIFRGKWRIITAFTFITTLISLIYSLVVPPVFLLKLVAEPQGEDGTLGVQALSVLSSFKFLETFIEEENLLPWLFSEKWDTGKEEWRVPIDDIPSLRKGALRLKKRLVVIQQKGNSNGDIVIGLKSTDPVRATVVVNTMIKKLNFWLAQAAIKEAEAKIPYYQRQLDLYESSSVVADNLDAIEEREVAEKDRVPITPKDVREQLNDFGGYMVRQNLIDEMMAYKNIIIEAKAERAQFALRVFDPASIPEFQERSWPKAIVLVPACLIGGFFFIVVILLGRGIVGRLNVD